jgi:hypothetical protein
MAGETPWTSALNPSWLTFSRSCGPGPGRDPQRGTGRPHQVDAIFRRQEPKKRMRPSGSRLPRAVPRSRKPRSCSAAGERASAQPIIDRQVHPIEQSRTMYAIAIVLLNALSFASLAYIANRKGYHTMAALAAAGAWLFGVTARHADLGDLALMSRRFPRPLSVEETGACFIVTDHAGRALAYVEAIVTDQKGLAFSTSSVIAEFHKPCYLRPPKHSIRVNVLSCLKYDRGTRSSAATNIGIHSTA